MVGPENVSDPCSAQSSNPCTTVPVAEKGSRIGAGQVKD